MPSPDARSVRNANKKSRRKFRHEIARRMRRVAIHRIGLFATGAQLREATRVLTDRYMHKVDHAPMTVSADPLEQSKALMPQGANG